MIEYYYWKQTDNRDPLTFYYKWDSGKELLDEIIVTQGGGEKTIRMYLELPRTLADWLEFKKSVSEAYLRPISQKLWEYQLLIAYGFIE